MSTPSLTKALAFDLMKLDPHENRDQVHRQRPDVGDVTITPSQAEGDREMVERDLDDVDDNFGGHSGGGQGDIQPTPSQAEGDRQEIERDLREKNQGGQA